jgi:hypothetical protein
MENNQKPEWFELADNDRAVIHPSKKKSGPIRSLTLILAGVLVIPMGAGFALLSHENHSATAAGTLNLTQDSPAAKSSTPALPVPVAKTTAAITPPGSASASNELILPPTKKADDDDDEEDEKKNSYGKKSKKSERDDDDDEEDDD